MKALTLLGLRVSLALLMVIWGVDKFVDPGHGAGVAARFYGGVLSAEAFMPVLGSFQLLLGVAVGLGAFPTYVYPALAAVTGITLIGVWRSVVDPWGWYLEGSNVLFFPSLVVVLSALVLIAFRDEDVLRLGGKEERLP
ncbi:MAG: hypothetical protein GWN70_19020 [Gemmatimonadetes bacterium]|nr:hypothetical protein [Gemmatimonadota bacterium]NIU37802.1 hypothetical protein [Gemmatimonadota bacterium]NIW66605.1 hypothetical protein [Gemmatimonadota bacterium]NIX41884.1 hypothetical protein [Gemmatimonadota bacterium]